MVASKRLRVRLSFKPFSTPNRPVLAIKVATCQTRRDGNSIEIIGKYHVEPDLKTDGRKHLEINFERAQYWLGKGAEPSSRVAWLFSKVIFMLFLTRTKKCCYSGWTVAAYSDRW